MKDITNWENTRIVRKRLADKIKDNTYLERPLIHKDSKVLGGIYPGATPREAIYVDEKSEKLEELYQKAKQKARLGRKYCEPVVLKAVYDTVREAIPYQVDDAVYRIFNHGKKDEKVSLDNFIEAGMGNCTHNALTCAALLEKFSDEGLIDGKISVDRNSLVVLGSHAWCRYTPKNNHAKILDVRADFCGDIQDGRKWNYFRPEEESE